MACDVIGLGDYTPQEITSLPDPCPLPLKERKFKRSLNEKEKVMYAPFCGVGGIVYDQDAVYIDLGGSHSHSKQKNSAGEETESHQNPLVDELRELTTTLDAKIDSAGLQIFSGSAELKLSDFNQQSNPVSTLLDDDEDMSDEDQVDEPEPIIQKSFTVVQQDDGRMRRKVIFDNKKRAMDDVTEEMQAELEKLKAAVGKSDDMVESEEKDSSESENDSENEDDESEKEEKKCAKVRKNVQLVGSKNPKKTDSKTRDHSKAKEVHKKSVKAKETKKNGIEFDESSSDSESEIEQDEDVVNVSTDDIKEEIATDDDEYEEAGKKQTFDEDEVKEEVEIASDDEMEFGEPVEKDDTDEESDEDDTDGETPDDYPDLDALKPKGESSSEKEERIAKAESAFYSRFRSRSLQKMIYDPAEDYLNVTSRADFDNANVAIRDDTGDMGSDEMKDLFIGGDYADTAKELLDADDEVDEDDFEMLDEDAPGKPTKIDAKPKNQAERIELKKKLKDKFDMEYDDGKDGKSFYQEWKSAMEEQSKVTFICNFNIH